MHSSIISCFCVFMSFLISNSFSKLAPQRVFFSPFFFQDILIPTLTLTQQVKSCVQFFQISVFVDKCVYIYRLHLPFSAISHLFFLASSNLPVKNPMFYHFVITFLNYSSFLAWWIGGVDSRPHGKLLSMHFRKAEVDQHSRSYFFFFPFGVGIFGAEKFSVLRTNTF